MEDPTPESKSLENSLGPCLDPIFFQEKHSGIGLNGLDGEADDLGPLVVTDDDLRDGSPRRLEGPPKSSPQSSFKDCVESEAERKAFTCPQCSRRARGLPGGGQPVFEQQIGWDQREQVVSRALATIGFGEHLVSNLGKRNAPARLKRSRQSCSQIEAVGSARKERGTVRGVLDRVSKRQQLALIVGDIVRAEHLGDPDRSQRCNPRTEEPDRIVGAT